MNRDASDLGPLRLPTGGASQPFQGIVLVEVTHLDGFREPTWTSDLDRDWGHTLVSRMNTGEVVEGVFVDTRLTEDRYGARTTRPKSASRPSAATLRICKLGREHPQNAVYANARPGSRALTILLAGSEAWEVPFAVDQFDGECAEIVSLGLVGHGIARTSASSDGRVVVIDCEREFADPLSGRPTHWSPGEVLGWAAKELVLAARWMAEQDDLRGELRRVSASLLDLGSSDDNSAEDNLAQEMQAERNLRHLRALRQRFLWAKTDRLLATQSATSASLDDQVISLFEDLLDRVDEGLAPAIAGTHDLSEVVTQELRMRASARERKEAEQRDARFRQFGFVGAGFAALFAIFSLFPSLAGVSASDVAGPFGPLARAMLIAMCLASLGALMLLALYRMANGKPDRKPDRATATGSGRWALGVLILSSLGSLSWLLLRRDPSEAEAVTATLVMLGLLVTAAFLAAHGLREVTRTPDDGSDGARGDTQ